MRCLFVCLLVLLPGCLGDLPTPVGSNSARSSAHTSGTGSAGSADPGTVTLHRLNSTEYNNTVHDLLGTQQTPGNNLPADTVAFGFDNNANSLTVSDATVRTYQQAAESLASEAANPNNAAEWNMLVTCNPASMGQAACLKQVVQNFAYRAWRRPLTDADTSDVLHAATANANDFVTQVNNAVTYVLMAPEFYFRVELDPSGSTAVHPLDDYALASRLSYFLWSSMPDDALLAAAASGMLQDDTSLLTQVHRMLADPKAAAFVSNFGDQWLELRLLALATPSPAVYPAWTEALRADMLAESERFFKDFVTGSQPITALFTAKYTYVNDRLAAFYGLTPPGGTALTQTPLPASNARGGVLTQGAWLTAMAHPDRSGIVARGKSVLSQLLCAPVPAPPPNIPPLSSSAGFAGTQRQHLEQHVSNAACAGCHNLMDPVGFAFESFDGIGAFRTQDANFPVDTSGTLGGKAFSNAADMDALIVSDARFGKCVVSNVFTYALGRAPEDTDQALLQQLLSSFATGGYKLPALIDQIVLSDAFRARHGGA